MDAAEPKSPQQARAMGKRFKPSMAASNLMSTLKNADDVLAVKNLAKLMHGSHTTKPERAEFRQIDSDSKKGQQKYVKFPQARAEQERRKTKRKEAKKQREQRDEL